MIEEGRVRMTGLWLASYLVLWGIVVVMCLFLIGILRQLGLLHRQLESGTPQPQGGGAIPTLEYDGPAIGLLYDEHSTLIRKGLVEGYEDLLALLGDRSAPERAQAHVFPRVVPSQV